MTEKPNADSAVVPAVPTAEQLAEGGLAPARELDLTNFEFVEVPIPYGHDEYTCPSCGKPIPTRRQINLARPARYAHLLNDVQKCPHCSFIFSYKTVTARVLRQ